MYDEQGKYEEAEGHYCRALSILTTALGGEHKQTADCRDKYASLLRALGREDEADALTQNPQIVVHERANVAVR